MQVLKRNTLPHSALLWLMLLAALWACLGAQTLGLKTASGQIYGPQPASWESTLLQAAPRLGLPPSAEKYASAPPVGANGGVTVDAIGPLRPSAIPVLKGQDVLINPSNGLQSSQGTPFRNVQIGEAGEAGTKYLYTVDNRGINVALEQTPVANNPVIKHTNLSSEAAIGGEAWFGANNTVTINAWSGRFGAGAGVTDAQWAATKAYWESLGYKVIAVPIK